MVEKPVVATPMTEVLRFEGVVRIAASGDAFVAAIEDELRSPAPVGPRWKVLEGETWKDKAELVSCWIEEALAAGGAPRTLEGTA